MGVNSELVMICTFLGVSALAGLPLLWIFGRKDQVAQRIDDLRDPHDAALRTQFQRARRQSEGTVSSRFARFGARFVPGSDSSKTRLVEQFMNAGIYSPAGPSIYSGVRFLAGVAFPLLVMLAGQLGVVSEQLSLILGWAFAGAALVGSGAWLTSRVRRRQRELRTSLPDCLDLLVTCLEAGQSFEAALVRVTEEMRAAHPVLALELGIVQREISLGSTPSKALRSCAERSGIDVLRQMSTLVDQAQRFGSNMSESLRIHSDMLRAQRAQRAESLAQKAGVKMLLPTLVFIFPPVLVILVGPAAIDLHQKFVEQHADVLSE